MKSSFVKLTHLTSIFLTVALTMRCGFGPGVTGQNPTPRTLMSTGCPETYECKLGEDPFKMGCNEKFSSNLPVLMVEIEDSEINGEESKGAFYLYQDTAKTKRTYLCSENLKAQGDIEIRLRGQTSREFPKKNYLLKMNDDAGEETDRKLAGLAKNSSFVLHGPIVDKSLIRNRLSYELADRTGEDAPKTKYAELVVKLDGRLDYYGIYLLTEKINRTSLNLKKNKPLEIEDKNYDFFSESYIFRLDPADDDKANLAGPMPFSVVYPKKKKLSKASFENLQKNIDSIDSLVLDENKLKNDEIWQSLDAVSFANNLIIQDIAADPDGLWKSQYLYKNKNEKLKMGPVWDFNLAYNNYIFADANQEPEEARDNLTWNAGIGRWTSNLFKRQDFKALLNSRWQELRKDKLSDGKVLSFISKQRKKIEEAQLRDGATWNTHKLYLRRGPETSKKAFLSEVEYLRTWVEKRLRHLDKKYLNL